MNIRRFLAESSSIFLKRSRSSSKLIRYSLGSSCVGLECISDSTVRGGAEESTTLGVASAGVLRTGLVVAACSIFSQIPSNSWARFQRERAAKGLAGSLEAWYSVIAV